MVHEELKQMDQRIEKLANGIGYHLETLLGQIDERLNQIETMNNRRFIKIDSMLEGKVFDHCD
ncbi:hypothetical protein [Litchfieldia alkalitelluris]|uniref:hypothetical protein n=1 Tax=Litchfieldia alkalitelluris TaxID=304268 RepID=UPI000996307C|nr:hypothetical protein [Litchfieldia alkalitelluris]